MNEGSIPSGWKKYPIQSEIRSFESSRDSRNRDRVATNFRPLEAGATFEFTIRYHNLRLIELGALLSTINFHNTPNTFHSIGMGKPLGYGKVEMQMKNKPDEYQEALCAFEAYMEISLSGKSEDVGKWKNSPQLIELVAMSSEHQMDSSLLNYMDLKDFVAIKRKNRQGRNNIVFKKHSQHENVNVPSIPSFIPDEAYLIAFYEKLQKEKELFNNRKSKKELFQEKINHLKEKFNQKLNEKIRSTLEALEKKRVEIRKEENKRNKVIKKDLALESGLDFSKVYKARKKDKFSALIKEIESFVERAYGTSIEKRFEEFSEGVIEKRYRKELIDMLSDIGNELSSKEKKKWKSTTHVRERIAMWVGKDKAQKFIDNL